MNTLQVVLFLYITHCFVSSHGVTNLLGFYTGVRKLCLCRCGITSNHFNKNTHTRTTDYMPWLARIQIGSTILRGTLISDRSVITAANPLYRKSASEVSVLLGSNDLCRDGSLNITAEAILVHPGYSPTVKNNDIALIRLRHPVQFNDFISPICMPIYDTEEDQLAWVASWLNKGSEYCISKISTIPILSHRNCNRNNSSMVLSDKSCLGPVGTMSFICENDTGGAVMTRWVRGSPFRLVGVITNAVCEKEVTPLFTRIVDNIIWIHENIRKDCQCF